MGKGRDLQNQYMTSKESDLFLNVQVITAWRSGHEDLECFPYLIADMGNDKQENDKQYWGRGPMPTLAKADYPSTTPWFCLIVWNSLCAVQMKQYISLVTDKSVASSPWQDTCRLLSLSQNGVKFLLSVFEKQPPSPRTYVWAMIL